MEQKVEKFLKNHIDVLPGATLIRTRGFWKGKGNLESENSWAVSTLLAEDATIEDRLLEIADSYIKEFEQFAVSYETQVVKYYRVFRNKSDFKQW